MDNRKRLQQARENSLRENREGLTFGQWLAAIPSHHEADRAALRKGWAAGEDPTEYEAHYQHERAQALRDAGR